MDLQLTKEAVPTGALLVPIYAVVRTSIVQHIWRNEDTRDYVAVFLSGALFHILAEASGANEWYITHGRANQKWLSKHNDPSAPRSWDARVCPLAVWASAQ